MKAKIILSNKGYAKCIFEDGPKICFTEFKFYTIEKLKYEVEQWLNTKNKNWKSKCSL